MIIITSLSPTHSNKDNQRHSLKSWQNKAERIYSMNCREEILILENEKYEGIQFLETCKTIEYFTGKFNVSINAMIDIARVQGQNLFLINSDIELTDLPELKDDGITLFSRYDWEELHTKANAKIFPHGYDAFYIPKQFLKIFPPSVYAMGVAWFDYAIPYHCMLKKIPLYYPNGIYAYHKIHKTHYPMEEWLHFARYFAWEFKFDRRLSESQVATAAIQNIKKYITKY